MTTTVDGKPIDYTGLLERSLAASDEYRRELENDVMVLALRLYGESPESMAPETRSVMEKWQRRVEMVLERDPLQAKLTGDI